MNETDQICQVPPKGWRCTRTSGHDGPCAAWPEDDAEILTVPVKGPMVGVIASLPIALMIWGLVFMSLWVLRSFLGVL